MTYRAAVVVSTTLLLFSLVGCTPISPYVSGFHFAPQPAMAVMFKEGTQTPALSVLVSVVGVRRGDPSKAVPPAVEMRMRFENNGTGTASFDPSSLRLEDGSLESFMSPEVHPSKLLEIPPGRMQMASVFFPFPPGISPRTKGLDALRLRWEVVLDGKPYLQTAVFERTSSRYYDDVQ